MSDAATPWAHSDVVPGVSIEAADAAFDAAEPDEPTAEDGVEFERFFRRYHRRVVTFLAGYVADRHLVHDLAQETLLRAYSRGLHREADGNQWAWLAKVARNLATDTARRAQSVHEVTADPADGEPAPDVPEDALLGTALRAGVADVLGSVSARQARILLARHVEGLGYEDIAVREGISVEAVRSSLFRARRTFRRRFERLIASRDLAAFPLLLASWRARFRTFRTRVRELASTSTPLEAIASTGMQSMATGAALGALTIAGSLSPGTSTPASLAAQDFSLPAAVEVVAVDDTDGGPAPEHRGVGASTAVHDAGADLPEPRPGFTVEPVRTEDIGPTRKAPARSGAEIDKDDNHTGISDHHEVDVDVDGDGESDVQTTGGTGIDCTPERRREVSTAVCPVLDETPDF